MNEIPDRSTHNNAVIIWQACPHCIGRGKEPTNYCSVPFSVNDCTVCNGKKNNQRFNRKTTVMKTCEYGVYNPTIDEVEPCGNLVEGNTTMCASHNAFFRKLEKQNLKSQEKHNTLIAKQREKAKQPRKNISKNPKDWSNTFLCSDGTRVTQAEINANLKAAYSFTDDTGNKTCRGCGGRKTCHGHIIPQARCKVIGKTELIWNFDNYFDSCFNCNVAIENPKGPFWKALKNIEKCLSFIKQHDPELYTKFELSAVNQETPTI